MADSALTPEGSAADWVKCSRCDMPQPKAPPSACAGASPIGGGEYICNNGRDCVLRYRRKCRQDEDRAAGRIAESPVEHRRGNQEGEGRG